MILKRRKRHFEGQRGRGKAGCIACLRVRVPLPRHQTRNDKTLVEGRCHERPRLARGLDKQRVVDGWRTPVPSEAAYEAYPPNFAHALPGRRDLERSHENDQAGGKRLVLSILEAITHTNRSAPDSLRLYMQMPMRGLPDDQGDRQETIRQLLAQSRIGPG